MLDVNAHDGEALVAATGNHYLRTMRLLLEHGAKINDRVWKSIEENDGDHTMKVILDHGYDPNKALIGFLNMNDAKLS